MASGQMSGAKRFLLWDYPRASWQYDVMVGLILAFIFLTPRTIFRDQRRVSSVVEVPSDRGRSFIVEPGLLEAIPAAERKARAESLIRARYGNIKAVAEVEPILNPEQELTGFMVFTTP